MSSLANALNWTASLTKPHLGPDGKPLLLDSAHDETGDWLRSFATPSSSADKEAILGHQISGRDPHSPSTGPYAYTPMAPARAYDPLSSVHTPIAPPPVVNLQPGGAITGNQPITIQNHIDVTGLVSTIMTQVNAKISGTLTGILSSLKSSPSNSPASFDGRAAPTPPDGSTFMK
jgi:hypothetical protein